MRSATTPTTPRWRFTRVHVGAIVATNLILALCMLASAYALYIQSRSLERGSAILLATTEAAKVAVCGVFRSPKNNGILGLVVGKETLRHLVETCDGTSTKVV